MAIKRIIRTAAGCAAVCVALVAATPAMAVEREIYLENACKHPIRVIVSHAPSQDSWDPHGWYEFTANEEPIKLLDTNDDPLLQLDDHAIFVYGESTDGSDIYWEGDDYTETFSEVNYGMKRAAITVVSGHFNIRLACDNVN